MKSTSLLSIGWQGYMLALIAGALTPFAFAPVGFYPLAVLSPAVLLALWSNAAPSRAFTQGLLFGIGSFGVGVSWVFISIHEFGNTAVPLAALLTFLFVILLALFTALQGYLSRRFFTVNPLTIGFVFPASWVLMEWIRGWIFSGFPWNLMGYSQINSPLAGYIPLIGEYGVSFLVVLSSALLVMFFRLGPYRKAIAIALLLIWSSGIGLNKLEWTQPKNAKQYSAALVQGNVPQELKWNPNYLHDTLKTYLQLTRLHWDKDIIVWPESAIPTAYQYVTNFLEALNTEAKATNTAVIVGIPMQHQYHFEDHFYNALVVLGAGSGIYFKRHLVPFGEYLPLKDLLRGLIAFFNIPMSDFIPGKMAQDNLKIMDLWVAPYICYEIAYAEVVRHNLPQAELLVTTSNDSWFGNSMAPWQHLEIGQFRALQTGRYMLFASNSGVTAIIDPKGRVIAMIPQFKEAVLSGKVQAMIGATPWVKIGTMPVIILLLVGLILTKLRDRKSKEMV